MKIRTGFVSNSSSSSFLVRTDSDYYKTIQKEPDFHFKSGSDYSRCTGVYTGQSLLNFANNLLEDGFCEIMAGEIVQKCSELGSSNIALVMVSDEEMGGTLTEPRGNWLFDEDKEDSRYWKDVIGEWEYH